MHQKWCIFFTAGSWEKDTIFGAVRKNFGSSYFVTALETTYILFELPYSVYLSQSGLQNLLVKKPDVFRGV